MTFKQSIKDGLGLKYFFKFEGRASRSEFWWFMLFIFLVNLGTGFVFFFLPPKVGASLSLVISLVLLPPNLGVTVRRLHDRNMSGWWLLVPVGCLLLTILAGGENSLLANLCSLAMCLGYLAILCMPGQPGPNRFGNPPNLDGAGSI